MFRRKQFYFACLNLNKRKILFESGINNRKRQLLFVIYFVTQNHKRQFVVEWVIYSTKFAGTHNSLFLVYFPKGLWFPGGKQTLSKSISWQVKCFGQSELCLQDFNLRLLRIWNRPVLSPVSSALAGTIMLMWRFSE